MRLLLELQRDRGDGGRALPRHWFAGLAVRAAVRRLRAQGRRHVRHWYVRALSLSSLVSPSGKCFLFVRLAVNIVRVCLFLLGLTAPNLNVRLLNFFSLRCLIVLAPFSVLIHHVLSRRGVGLLLPGGEMHDCYLQVIAEGGDETEDAYPYTASSGGGCLWNPKFKAATFSSCVPAPARWFFLSSYVCFSPAFVLKLIFCVYLLVVLEPHCFCFYEHAIRFVFAFIVDPGLRVRFVHVKHALVFHDCRDNH